MVMSATLCFSLWCLVLHISHCDTSATMQEEIANANVAPVRCLMEWGISVVVLDV